MPDDSKSKFKITPIIPEQTMLVDNRGGKIPLNQRTSNQLLRALVSHVTGKDQLVEGSAIHAVATAISDVPMNTNVVFLARPHSNWIQHIIMVDEGMENLVLDANTFVSSAWEKNKATKEWEYTARDFNARYMTLVPRRVISVEELIKKGMIHFEVKALKYRKRPVDEDPVRTPDKILEPVIEQVKKEIKNPPPEKKEGEGEEDEKKEKKEVQPTVPKLLDFLEKEKKKRGLEDDKKDEKKEGPTEGPDKKEDDEEEDPKDIDDFIPEDEEEEEPSPDDGEEVEQPDEDEPTEDEEPEEEEEEKPEDEEEEEDEPKKKLPPGRRRRRGKKKKVESLLDEPHIKVIALRTK